MALSRRGFVFAPAFAAFTLFSLLSSSASAQPWQSILTSSQAIDWSASGVGAIPARPTICTTLTPVATVVQIDSALAACSPDQSVFLAAGTYNINGTIHIPSHVTLRGAGAGRTILNATGVTGGPVISLGAGEPRFAPVRIAGGTTAESTQITLAAAAHITPGTYLVITETNDPAYVSSSGSEGNCHWCDGGWTKDGSLARGQIVSVTAIADGATITISPGLYASYTNTPIAVPFAMSASYAGVEDLQVRANNTGYDANFAMSACAYCWIKGVESNYTDAEHVSIRWGYRDEVRDSYFSNAFNHTPGLHDSDIQLALKTSASLIENNIIERGHESVMLEWGAAGNVIAYNYMMGGFDSGSPDVVIGGIDYHGAHPQFNLLEGNVVTSIYADPVWGTSSHTTAFRNWVVGTNRVCTPLHGRGDVNCSGANGHFGFQAARAMQMSYLTTHNNFVGNVVGSRQMQSLVGYSRPLSRAASVEYPAKRSYDAVAYGWSFGYGGAGDDGSGTGCNGGAVPCHRAETSRTDFFHGNSNNAGGSIAWSPGVARSLPASFYLAAKPAWWGPLPFPATGPDIRGGPGPQGHSFGNPAMACYLKVMDGSDGGVGSPLSFDPASCYGNRPVAPRSDPPKEPKK